MHARAPPLSREKADHRNLMKPCLLLILTCRAAARRGPGRRRRRGLLAALLSLSGAPAAGQKMDIDFDIPPDLPDDVLFGTCCCRLLRNDPNLSDPPPYLDMLCYR